MVHAVDLVGGEPAALGGHDVDVHRFQQRQEPHALVRGGREGQRRGEKKGSKEFFHMIIMLLFVKQGRFQLLVKAVSHCVVPP